MEVFALNCSFGSLLDYANFSWGLNLFPAYKDEVHVLIINDEQDLPQIPLMIDQDLFDVDLGTTLVDYDWVLVLHPNGAIDDIIDNAELFV